GVRCFQRHGRGQLRKSNGDCVNGIWRYDVLEGEAVYTSREEGWRFSGTFVGGKWNGPGKIELEGGDTWECQWAGGEVVTGSGVHTTVKGDMYMGGCVASQGNRKVPCRTGHGRLKWREGDQVETKFRDGKALDGAKGVVKFRNGAIFFGQLRGARPHGQVLYGEIYLSSARAVDARMVMHNPIAKLDEMARNLLWYKGDFQLGLPHGTGLVKYRD
ncbi:unnamed protein product, partial [Choristocarpus tenellus]